MQNFKLKEKSYAYIKVKPSELVHRQYIYSWWWNNLPGVMSRNCIEMIKIIINFKE